MTAKAHTATIPRLKIQSALLGVVGNVWQSPDADDETEQHIWKQHCPS